MGYTGRCNMCGICCRAITVSKKVGNDISLMKKDYTKMSYIISRIDAGLSVDDVQFAACYWEEISLIEAKRLSSGIKEAKVTIADRKNMAFKCTLVTDGGMCGKYDTRPGVCKYYPRYYEYGNPKGVKLINQHSCGYIETKDEEDGS